MGQNLLRVDACLEADDFVDKPIRPTELLLRVEKLLRRTAYRSA